MEWSSGQLAREQGWLGPGSLRMLMVITHPKRSSCQDVPHLTSFPRTYPTLPAQDRCLPETVRSTHGSFFRIKLYGDLGLQAALSLRFPIFALQTDF